MGSDEFYACELDSGLRGNDEMGVKKVFTDQKIAGEALPEIMQSESSPSPADEKDLVFTVPQDEMDPEWEAAWLGDFTCG